MNFKYAQILSHKKDPHSYQRHYVTGTEADYVRLLNRIFEREKLNGGVLYPQSYIKDLYLAMSEVFCEI